MSGSLTYGLGPGGFVRMRLPEIRRLIFDDLAARIGQPFDETPDSLSGQFVGVFAERLAALWELAEAVHLSAYPSTAQGTALDLAVSYAGVRRIQASSSLVRGVFYGSGTVPIGSVVESTVTPEGMASPPRYAVVQDVIISRRRAAVLHLQVPTPVNGVSYIITWNGLSASVVASGSPTSAAVATNLAGQLVVHGATAIAVGNEVRITSDTQFLGTWANVTPILVASPGFLAAVDTGVAIAPAGSLTTIVTPVAGWASVTNPADAVAGTTLETDEELRQRYTTGVYRLGAGTVLSIRANLQQVPGVTSVVVYENFTDVTDAEGRPPHSVEAVVEGGDPLAVATELFRVKPAGIRSHGNTANAVVDGTGFANPVSFSRPELRWIWLNAVLTTTAEEVVPGDVAAVAADAMIAYGNSLRVGENVYLQRVSSSIFEVTTGVASVALTAVATAVGAGAPVGGAYVSTDIAIGPRQRAVFALNRTAVT